MPTRSPLNLHKFLPTKPDCAANHRAVFTGDADILTPDHHRLRQIVDTRKNHHMGIAFDLLERKHIQSSGFFFYYTIRLPNVQTKLTLLTVFFQP